MALAEVGGLVAFEDDDLNVLTERSCAKCGDEVLLLSSRDWCDGCEETAADPG